MQKFFLFQTRTRRLSNVGRLKLFGKSYSPMDNSADAPMNHAESPQKVPETPTTPKTIQTRASDSYESGGTNSSSESSSVDFPRPSELNTSGSSRDSIIVVSSSDFTPIFTKFASDTTPQSKISVITSTPIKIRPQVLDKKFEVVKNKPTTKAVTKKKKIRKKPPLAPIEEKDTQQSNKKSHFEAVRRVLKDTGEDIMSLLDSNSILAPIRGDNKGKSSFIDNSSRNVSNWWKETTDSVKSVNEQVSNAFAACIVDSQIEMAANAAVQDGEAALQRKYYAGPPLDQSWLNIPDDQDDAISRLTVPAELKSCSSYFSREDSDEEEIVFDNKYTSDLFSASYH